MADTGESRRSFALTFGLERLGLGALLVPWLSGIVILALSVVAGMGLLRLGVDDSLSELFRTDTPAYRQYEAIDRLFPSSEYDILVVVEGADLLKRDKLAALSSTLVDLQLADGVNGLVSMLSARGKPDATGYAPPVVPDTLPPEGAAYDALIKTLRTNEIVAGKFLSDDGTLALAVISLDRKQVQEHGPKAIIGAIRETAEKGLAGTGLKVQLTGAPVMQLEIRNAVEHDQLAYNGLGLLFGAGIALVFFRRVSLMLLAAIPPVIAVVWSLGVLGWLGFKMNLFLNVMTPLVMVMGFSDSMQVVSAIRDRLRHGDSKLEALRFVVLVVGPACVLAHATALISFLALLISDSALIKTFGTAGAIATVISYFAVVGVLPVIGLVLVPGDGSLSRERVPSDRAMDWLGDAVGAIVDRVVARPFLVTAAGLLLFGVLGLAFSKLEPRDRLADQVPDREQALAATGRLDQKLTGANPVHVMIRWHGPADLYDPATLSVITSAHEALEKTAGLGNVWSLDSLRRWLADAGDTRIETLKSYVQVLPQHLVRRFIAASEKAVLVTGRLPDVDASQILPVVDRIDRALDPVRKAHPGYEISVTGLPAIAARSSSGMIRQLMESVPIAVGAVAILIGLAFRSPASGIISLLPGIFPIVATGAGLWALGLGIEFASVVALIVIFGLGVDALVHFLNRLAREERPGEDPGPAIRRARVLVGPAIILTTVVLAFGLGVTVFSGLPSLRLFGAVCGVALVASLFGDLVFLPALVAVFRRLWPITR
ncbi:MAG: RND family transporter [Hyphomicrobiaceae bacterium]